MWLFKTKPKPEVGQIWVDKWGETKIRILEVTPKSKKEESTCKYVYTEIYGAKTLVPHECKLSVDTILYAYKPCLDS